jgi:hypothetical protein
MSDSVLKLHAQVQIVNGYRRAAFYDLGREVVYYARLGITLGLERILPCARQAVEGMVSEEYGDAQVYMDWMLQKELLFEMPTSMLLCFPAISLDLNVPGRLWSASLGHSTQQHELIEALCSLGVRYLVIDCGPVDRFALKRAVDEIPVALPLLSVVLWIDEDSPISAEDVAEVVENRFCVTEISRQPKIGTSRTERTIAHDRQPRMRCNLTHFIEARLFNVAFNRHLHIDESGLIFEGHRAGRSIGHVDPMRLVDSLLEADANRILQDATKDKTSVCGDCEHRYMCMDPRVPDQRADGTWYHVTECPYNPYICKWKGGGGYRSLAECGIKSDATGFTIDHDRIAEINAELWGE